MTAKEIEDTLKELSDTVKRQELVNKAFKLRLARLDAKAATIEALHEEELKIPEAVNDTEETDAGNATNEIDTKTDDSGTTDDF